MILDPPVMVAALEWHPPKNVKEVEWDEKCQKSFEELKKRLTTVPVLTLPQDIEGFTVTVTLEYKILVV